MGLGALALGALYYFGAFDPPDHGEDEAEPDDEAPDAAPDDTIVEALSASPSYAQALAGPLSVVVAQNSGALGLSNDDLAVLLAAIANRETACGTSKFLSPPNGGPSATGDGGHGRGLMQIDDRWHPAFTSGEDWKDPTKNLAYGLTRVLVPSFKSLGDLRQAIAAYNCGNGSSGKLPGTKASGVRGALAFGADIDANTTGGDYSADVLAHARAWGFSG